MQAAIHFELSISLFELGKAIEKAKKKVLLLVAMSGALMFLTDTGLSFEYLLIPT